MVNVGSPDLQRVFPGRTEVSWAPDLSLKEFLEEQFKQQLPVSQGQYLRSLNVFEIEKICGLDIKWTDSLGDHLHVDLDLNIVNIYHHVEVLKGLLSAKPPTTFYPDGFLEETIQTLALLIPQSNSNCRSWYKRQQKLNPNQLDSEACNLILDPMLGRKVSNYKYWNERLDFLYEAFQSSASQPKSLSQFWNDRRNKVQWYTFWIAVTVLVLTIVFGLIQSITGIIQVNLAYHPIGY
ncbi:hypothetical protein L207DRAFT_497141 [Hyaloscypha variabilis F]|uniref:Uncharacterized protein n=1 Tax=Hyaloscypha variabilis (strain UAMH 11265 / GT02V1 / F) TaxID=1149755 RepID=A0A2J6R998_HYAVF|nr:hypothetical protein L207DRAFT_497141 [Hyaloscypha variabilis F]